MNKSTHRFTIVALAGLGVAALAATTGVANSASEASSVQCGIARIFQGNMMVIEGTVRSPVALSGEYGFAIRSQGRGGSATINQGGEFAVLANEETSIGKVSVNAGSSVVVDFTVTANGQTIDCNEDVTTL